MDLANTGPVKGIDSNALCCHGTHIWPRLHIRNIRTALWASNSDLLYIIAGCLVFVIGMKALMIPHQLLGGGVAGIVLLFHYLLPGADMGLLYFLLNLPLIFLGWRRLGKRFMVLTVFGMAFFSVAAEWAKPPEIMIQDRMIATVLASMICGLGGGLILRSCGSAGGFDILSIVLSRKTGHSVANWSLALNSMPLVAGLWFYDLGTIFYSCLFHIACSRVVKVVMAYHSSHCINGHLR
jgi:uncharacterized membrane-anchored protein YitT (DUF2179 family)